MALLTSRFKNAILKNQRTRRRRVPRDRKGKPLQRLGLDLESQTYVIPHFLDLWVAHAPVRLQDSIAEWIRKEKENQFALSEFSSFPQCLGSTVLQKNFMCSCTMVAAEVHPESLSVYLVTFREMCRESCKYTKKNVVCVSFMQLVGSGVYKYD